MERSSRRKTSGEITAGVIDMTRGDGFQRDLAVTVRVRGKTLQGGQCNLDLMRRVRTTKGSEIMAESHWRRKRGLNIGDDSATMRLGQKRS